MPPRLDEVATDRGLAELLAGLEPVQPFDQDEALAVRPHQDRGLLADFQHALGDFPHAFRVERRAALHGFLATLESWRGLVPLVPDRELWLFDLKGHGASPCPADGKYTVQDQADLVLARILEEDMRELTLIGHSFGCGVALLVAIALVKEAKGRLTSLVLIDSLAFPEALSWWARWLRRVWPLAYG